MTEDVLDDEPPPHRPPGWRRRRARRRAISVVVVLAVLTAAGYVAWTRLVRDEPRRALPACTSGAGSTQAGGHPAPTRFPPGKPLPVAKVHVIVYNSTSRAGLARMVSRELARRHFVVTAVGNDPRGRVVSAPAEIRFGPAGVRAALTLADQIDGAVPREDKRTGPGVDLALGNAYRSLRSPALARAHATPLPAANSPKAPAPIPSCSPTP